jgi:hypothetical protein
MNGNSAIGSNLQNMKMDRVSFRTEVATLTQAAVDLDNVSAK